jgi:hypothetical protein
MKTHTKDYLNEFKTTQSSWLKNLIDEAINSNGNILEEKLNSIYKLLKNELEESALANATIIVCGASLSPASIFAIVERDL